MSNVNYVIRKRLDLKRKNVARNLVNLVSLKMSVKNENKIKYFSMEMSSSEKTLFDLKKEWWHAIAKRQELDEECINLQIELKENKEKDGLKRKLEHSYHKSLKNDEYISKLSVEMMQCEKNIKYNDDIEIIDVYKQNILDIPIDRLTIELCEMYVRKDGSHIRYVPDHMKTDNICKMAVRVNGLNIRYLPRDLRTRDICWMALEQNVNSFHYVPKKLRTFEMCHYAVSRNSDLLLVVPKNMRNKINS